MKIVVVIPAYNEAAVIGQVVIAVKKYIETIVVVNDGSRDTTALIARDSGALVVTHAINRGYGAATMTGIYQALRMNADIIITLDADGQFDPADIVHLMNPPLNNQADIVIGNRFAVSTSIQNTTQQSLGVRMRILRIAALVTRWYTGVPVYDPHNGFRALNRRAAMVLDCRQDGMAFSSEIIEQIARHGLRFMHVPVSVRYTEYSVAKGQKVSNAFSIVWHLFMSRLTK